MTTMTIRADVLSERLETDYFFDIDSLDNAIAALENSLELSAAASDLLDQAISADPTTITATAVRWGSATDGLFLTGSGLSQIGDLAALEAALEGGIASGAFDQLTVVSGGQTYLNVAFAPGRYTITAGNTTFTVAGTLPDTIQDMYDVLSTFAELVANEDPNGSAARQLLISVFDDYAVSGLTINDGTQDVVDISIGTSALSLEAAGARAELTGTFPTASLGDLISFLEAYTDSDITDLALVPELAVSNFKLTDREGRLQVEIDGAFGDVDPLFLDTVTVNGTGERDSGIYLPWFSESEAGEVLVNMGAGYDSLIIDTDEYYYSDDAAPTTIDMGADGGITVLDSYQGGDYLIDFGAREVTLFWEEYAGYDPVNNVSIFENREYTFDYVELDRIELGDAGYFYGPLVDSGAIGTEANERIVIGQSGHALFFAGGGGHDIVDMHRTYFVDADQSGITYDDFVANMSFTVRGDYLGFDLFETGLGDTVLLNLLDVDQIQFKLGEDGREYRDVSEILGEIDVLAGGSSDDVLKGTESGRTYLGLGGNDEIYAGGFLGRFSGNAAGQVYRLYQATLDRAPDTGGFNGWAEILDTGTQTITEVARGFVNSAEFRSVYEDLSDADFVGLLYQNVLGRAADAGGLQGWLDAMAGGLAREGVVTGLSESREFRTNTANEAATFANNADPASWSDEVFRVYQATFARDPDVAGFQGWTTLLSTGTTLDQAISGFTKGREFTNTYGEDLTDAEFVELLYQNVLGRAADAGGLQGWLDAMAGGLAREGVVKGFSEAREFRENTADDLRGWMRTNTPDNTIQGGDGVNILSGGIGSDTFVFDINDDADNTVLDLEAWDYIQFQAGGDLASIKNAMQQVGNDVVFEDGDLKITFLNTMFDDMTDDMFIL